MSIAFAVAATLAAQAPTASVHYASMQKSQSRAQAGQPATEESSRQFERAIELFFEQFYAGQYDKALKTASEIDVDDANAEGEAVVKAMRGAALVGLKRDKEATKLFTEADAAAPSMTLVSTLQFDAGLQANNIEIAAAALDRMISRNPDAVRDLGMDDVSYLLRNEPKGQERRNEDRRIALGQLGYGGATGDYYAADAVDILMKHGETAKAAELLSRIDDPGTIESYLIAKRYSALWPKLEATVGDHLSNMRESSVRATRKEYDDNPDSAEKREFYIGALWQAGHLNAAIAFRSELPSTAAALANVDSDTGWAFNNVAFALHEAGRKEEADQLFALLNEAEIERSGWWRVNMIINRLELLVADGKFDRAMLLMGKAEVSAKKDGNAYGQQLVRRLRFCTVSQLGRKDEAASLLPELLKHADDARGPTINALVCAGQLDEAEKLMLAALEEDEDFERYFIHSLQAKPLTADYPSVWDEAWHELRKRPAIAKEFERLGRDMPEQYLPPPVAK